MDKVRPIKVAMLCKGDDGYGVGAVLKLYAQNMPDLIFVCFCRGPMFHWLEQNGNRVLLIEGLANFTATSSAHTLMRLPMAMVQAKSSAVRLHKLLAPLGVTIVHAHWLPQYFIAGFMRRLNYSSVWHIHGNMNPRRMFGMGARLNHILARWGADLLISVSDFIAEKWRGAGVSIYTIHNAAIQMFNGSNEIPTSPLRCLIAGRLTPDKGHHLAIQAVLSLRRSGYDVRLDIFGGPVEDNPYFDDLHALVKGAQQQEYVRFMGFSTELRLHHQTYNLGLQCRTSPEPCSMWICESLADGLPLLAANAGGTAELIEDGITGILFRCGDVNDLTDKLTLIASNSIGLNAMRQSAYIRGKNLFRPGRFIEQTCHAYHSLSNQAQSTQNQ